MASTSVPTTIPKPPAFWLKLLGLFIVAFCGVLTVAIPEIVKGNYIGIPAAIGLAALTALGYSLDPNHASASHDQIVQSVLAVLHSAETNVPIMRQAIATPLIGATIQSVGDSFTTVLADKLADAVASGQMSVAEAQKALTQATLAKEGVPVSSVLSPAQQSVLDQAVAGVTAKLTPAEVFANTVAQESATKIVNSPLTADQMKDAISKTHANLTALGTPQETA